MSHALATLNALKAELGEQAFVLSLTPLDKVITRPQQQEPDAISFKIFFGYIVDQYTKEERRVWVYLYPAERAGGSVQIQFHSTETNLSKHARYDGDVMSKIVSKRAEAFERKMSKEQLVALSKYYFLGKLAESGFDNEKMEFGTSINISFKRSILAACRMFEDTSEKTNRRLLGTVTVDGHDILEQPSSSMNGGPSSARRAPEDTPMQDSEKSAARHLSEAPPALLDGEREAPNNNPEGSERASSVTVATPSVEGPEVSSRSEVIAILSTLQDKEDSIVESLYKLGQGTAAKQALREHYLSELKLVDSTRERLLEGMSRVDAYKLSRDVDTKRATKHRRTR